MLHTNKGLVCIVLFALFVNLIFFIALKPWDERVMYDKILRSSHGYDKKALSIIGGGSSAFGANITPGYPLFIVLFYLLFGIKVWPALFAQVLLYCGTVILVYLVAKETLYSTRIALIAAFLYSINFDSIYYSSTKILSETFFVFIFVLAVYVFVRAFKETKTSYFAVSGVLMGAATLVRIIALALPFILPVFIFTTKKKLGTKLYCALIFILAYVITLSPWQLRNLYKYGHYSLSTQGSYNLCCWNVTYAKALAEDKTRQEAYGELIGGSVRSVANPFEKAKMYSAIATTYILRHPLVVMRYHLLGVLRLFFSTQNRDILKVFTSSAGARMEYFFKLFLIEKLLLQYMLFIIGMAAAYKKGRRDYILLFLVIILYFGMIPGIAAYARFRVPIMPFVLIFSAKGVDEIWKDLTGGVERKMG